MRKAKLVVDEEIYEKGTPPQEYKARYTPFAFTALNRTKTRCAASASPFLNEVADPPTPNLILCIPPSSPRPFSHLHNTILAAPAVSAGAVSASRVTNLVLVLVRWIVVVSSDSIPALAPSLAIVEVGDGR